MAKDYLNISELVAEQRIILQISGTDLTRFARQLILASRAELRSEHLYAGTQLEPLYDTAEVKAALKIKDSTLYRWAQKGYLVPIIVGGEKRYRKSDLDRILHHKKTE